MSGVFASQKATMDARLRNKQTEKKSGRRRRIFQKNMASTSHDDKEIKKMTLALCSPLLCFRNREQLGPQAVKITFPLRAVVLDHTAL